MCTPSSARAAFEVECSLLRGARGAARARAQTAAGSTPTTTTTTTWTRRTATATARPAGTTRPRTRMRRRPGAACAPREGGGWRCGGGKGRLGVRLVWGGTLRGRGVLPRCVRAPVTRCCSQPRPPPGCSQDEDPAASLRLVTAVSAHVSNAALWARAGRCGRPLARCGGFDSSRWTLKAGERWTLSPLAAWACVDRTIAAEPWVPRIGHCTAHTKTNTALLMCGVGGA